jgi:hypothetical protein
MGRELNLRLPDLTGWVARCCSSCRLRAAAVSRRASTLLSSLSHVAPPGPGHPAGPGGCIYGECR